uniref:Uncharacterized protein n=1 Tax=Equus caballus TaxID=9796 RepID=A0A9L0T1F6_HORSE
MVHSDIEHEVSKWEKNEFKKPTFILIITFYILILQLNILNTQYESHMLICSASCALHISYSLSFKMCFQEMNASLKVIECIYIVFKL